MECTGEIIALKTSADAQQLRNKLQIRWLELENTPNVFRYKLAVEKERVLSGECMFFSQLNTNRAELRRAPVTMNSVMPAFSDQQFNFTKVPACEELLKVDFNDTEITFLVNQSPLTTLHTLIVPEMQKKLPQIINELSIRFAITFLRLAGDECLKIGYNSAGAFASVNHLHLHLLYLEKELYVSRAELEEIKGNIFRLSTKHPTKAICFILNALGNIELETQLTHKIYMLCLFMCENNIPHNLYFALSKEKGNVVLKVVVFAKEKPQLIKCYTGLNIAFCESSGYVPLGNEELFNKLTEEDVANAINSDAGSVYDVIEKFILDNL